MKRNNNPRPQKQGIELSSSNYISPQINGKAQSPHSQRKRTRGDALEKPTMSSPSNEASTIDISEDEADITPSHGSRSACSPLEPSPPTQCNSHNNSTRNSVSPPKLPPKLRLSENEPPKSTFRQKFSDQYKKSLQHRVLLKFVQFGSHIVEPENGGYLQLVVTIMPKRIQSTIEVRNDKEEVYGGLRFEAGQILKITVSHIVIRFWIYLLTVIKVLPTDA